MSTQPITADQPVELKLGDGSVVKGANLQEAFDNLKTMKENASKAKMDAERERDQYRQQVESLQQQVEQSRPRTQDDGKSFNKEHYYSLLNQDPIEAQDYIDRYRWEMDPKQVRQRFEYIGQQVDNLTQQSVAAAFLAQHAEDFPGDPDAAKAMTSRMNELSLRGLPFNIDTMNYAYSQLVNEQAIKPAQRQEEVTEQANPSLSGAGRPSTEDAELKKAEMMSDADLEKLLRSKGVLR